MQFYEWAAAYTLGNSTLDFYNFTIPALSIFLRTKRDYRHFDLIPLNTSHIYVMLHLDFSRIGYK